MTNTTEQQQPDAGQNITAKGTLGEMPMQSEDEYKRNTKRAKAAPSVAETTWQLAVKLGQIAKERDDLQLRNEALVAALRQCETNIPDSDITKHRDRIAEINGIVREVIYAANEKEVQ